jgi:hypothetical protein
LVLLLSASLGTGLKAQTPDAPGHLKLADDAEEDANGLLFSFLGKPRSVSANGDVMFVSSYSETGVSYSTGLWLWAGGTLQTIAKRNLPTPQGGREVFWDVVDQHGNAVMSSSGHMSFQAETRLPPFGTSSEVVGLYLRVPGGPTYRMAYEGQPAPGGGTFKELRFQGSWSMSDNGTIVFFSQTNAGAGGGFYLAKLNGSTPVLTAVALHGAPAPGGTGTFDLADDFDGIVPMAVNDAGLVMFTAKTSGDHASFLFVWDGTTISRVPNSRATELATMNNLGQIAFEVSTGYGLPAGIYKGNVSATTRIVGNGDPMPGGGTFGSLWGKPVINDSGKVAFTSNGQGVFLWSDGTLTEIARVGSSAPGGGTYGMLLDIAVPFLTNSGYVVFKGPTSGGDRIFMSDGIEAVAAVAVGDKVNGLYVGSVATATDSGEAPYISDQFPVNDAGQLCYLANLKLTPSGTTDHSAVLRFTPPSRWWTGGSGTWDLAEHWKFRFTPGAQRDVIIDPSSSATITGPAADATVRTLQVGGSGVTTRLELTGGSTVTTTAGLTIKPFGVLAGPGKISGDLVNDGSQEVKNTDPVNNLAAASFTNRSHAVVRLLDNTTTFGGMTAASATISDGAQVDLDLDSAGSSVDFTLPFWKARRSWTLLSAPTVTGRFVLGASSAPESLFDSNGVAATVHGSFTVTTVTNTSPQAVKLEWAPLQFVPFIATPPAGAIVEEGAALTLSVVGTGNALKYEWFKNGVLMPLAVDSTFSVSAAAFANAGKYKVRISNDKGQQTSAEVLVGVVDADASAVSVTEASTLTLEVAVATPPSTSFSFQWKKGGTNLSDGPLSGGQSVTGATKAKLIIKSVNASAADSYTCELSLPALPTLTTDARMVTVVPEMVAPAAPKILAPVSGASIPLTLGGTVTVIGTATDNHSVGRVLVALNGGSPMDATLATPNAATTTFSAVVSPTGGVNTLRVQTIDINGSTSIFATRSFKAVINSSITVLVNPPDSGTVTLPAESANFKVGFPYSITAKPSTGQVFNGWTVNDLMGTGITGTMQELPVLTFNHQDGLVLTANFVPNPFTAGIVGKFAGLVQPSVQLPDRQPSGAGPEDGTVAAHDAVGLLALTVTGSGSFTGSLKIDGVVLPLSGIFDSTGVARFGKLRATTADLLRLNKPSLQVSLMLDLTGLTNVVSGTVVQHLRGVAVAHSTVKAHRAAFSAANKVPSIPDVTSRPYTMVFRHITDQAGFTSADYPQGDGYATGTVKPDGSVAFVGKLADGTAFSSGVGALSKGMRWPLYASLYSGRGSVSAWVQVDTSASDTDMLGSSVRWFRPYQSVHWYPWGWPEGITAEIIASQYTKPALPSLNPIDLGIGNATLEFQGGTLTGTMTRNLNIDPLTSALSKVTKTDSSFTCSLTSASGLVAGSFTHPTDGSKPVWQGVLYQKGANRGGHGYFQTTKPNRIDGTGVSGSMKLVPR